MPVVRSSMNRRLFPLSRAALAAVCIALSTAGCMCVDGSFLYTVSGRLLDGGNKPLADLDFIIVPKKFDKFHRAQREDFDRLDEWFNIQTTDKDGKFSYEYMTGLAWGGCKPFGIGIKQPETPAIDKVHIYYRTGPDTWDFRILDVPAGKNPPEKIVMGDVRL